MFRRISNRVGCEFSHCNCRHYLKGRSLLCRECQHGKCWHQLVYRSTQFDSPRLSARRPRYYEYSRVPRIFTPRAPMLPIVVAEPIYCATVELLPA